MAIETQVDTWGTKLIVLLLSLALSCLGIGAGILIAHALT